MNADSPETAKEAFENVRGFYQRFGQVVETHDVADEAPWFIGVSFGQTAGVYLNVQTVGGSMDAGSVEVAEQLLRELTAESKGAK